MAKERRKVSKSLGYSAAMDLVTSGSAACSCASVRPGRVREIDLLRAIRARPVEGPGIEGCDVCEEVALFAEGVVIAAEADFHGDAADALPEGVHARWFGEGKGAEEDGVDQAEDGGVGAD